MINRSTYAEIDVSALRANYDMILSRIATYRKIHHRPNPSRLCAVVKADAYGHGAVEVAKIALEKGASYLAVATPDEAEELRSAGIKAPILNLGLIGEESISSIVVHDVTQTVASVELARCLSSEALRQGKTLKVHLKVDTGMGRIGIPVEDVERVAGEVAKLPSIELEGIFSHFATADSDRDYTRLQLERFMQAVESAEQAVHHPLLKHLAESEAILDIPEAAFDMVRAGIIQYGLQPAQDLPKDVVLHPVMRLVSKILFLKEIERGTSIGYGRGFVAKRKTKIATLPIGYADGYIRAYGGHMVEVRGVRAPIAGRVCMDQVMVDVTDVEGVAVGDEVTLFGSPTLTADEVADWLGTINYEVVCLISKRVPRVYI